MILWWVGVSCSVHLSVRPSSVHIERLTRAHLLYHCDTCFSCILIIFYGRMKIEEFRRSLLTSSCVSEMSERRRNWPTFQSTTATDLGAKKGEQLQNRQLYEGLVRQTGRETDIKLRQIETQTEKIDGQIKERKSDWQKDRHVRPHI